MKMRSVLRGGTAEMKDAYIDEMKRRLGADAESYLRALGEPPLKGLHVNAVKAAGFDPSLTGARLERLPFGGGCYAVAEGAPARSPYYAAGLYYMQEPSAMLPVAFAEISAGAKVLDICAAPGGKSCMAASALRGSGLLVSNDADRSRAAVLRENIVAAGYTNVAVTNRRAEELPEVFGGAFDVVIADAPCSGEGMMRKEPQAAFDWSPKNIAACAERQRRILLAADGCLKEGGLLVYSTCTFSREEDEDNALFMLGRGYEEVRPTDPFLLPYACEAGYKFYPHTFRGEGQYFCLMRKCSAGRSEKRMRSPTGAGVREKNALSRIMDTDGLRIARMGDMLYAPALAADLPCRANGVLLATVERDGRLTPAHQAATAFGKRFRISADVPHGDGRINAYLRGEGIACDCAPGWCAVTYGGYPVGLGKASGGVVKNKYPKFLRRTE